MKTQLTPLNANSNEEVFIYVYSGKLGTMVHDIHTGVHGVGSCPNSHQLKEYLRLQFSFRKLVYDDVLA